MLLSYVFQKNVFRTSIMRYDNMYTCTHRYVYVYYILTIIDAHTHTETRNYAHSTKPPLKSCNV